jgi:GT2 family glycosyltransferase
MIDIVIVNWNASLQLFEAISSINQHHHSLVSSIIIVDNASTDDSLARAPSATTLPLRIISNRENLGFGIACNQGAALSSSEFLLFLNPDTRLFGNSLTAPIAFMQNPDNEDVGIVGIQLMDESGRVARSCARFPSMGIFLAQALGVNRVPGLRHWNTHMSTWAHNETETVDHVIGAFYLMRRSLFELLGGFDERFFVYFEDLDLSYRAHRAGWRSVYLTEAQAFHTGGGTSRQAKAQRLFYSLRSRLLYGFKHLPPWQAWALFGISISLEPVTRSLFSIIRDGWEEVRNVLQAYGMLYKDLGNINKKISLK